MQIHNRGSTTVEVTLIMPIIMMMMVLFVTMLLGVFQQAKVHSGLMLDQHRAKHAISMEKTISGDKEIYSEAVEIQLIEGYPLQSVEYQVQRISDVEQKLRRWQVLGDLVSE